MATEGTRLWKAQLALSTCKGSGYKICYPVARGATGSLAPSNDVKAGDMNGDGITDIVSVNNGGIENGQILIGNADGSFRSRVSFSGGDRGVALADLNGDDALDIASNSSGDGVNVNFAKTEQSILLPRLNLNSQASALATLPILDQAAARISAQLGVLGASERRLQSCAAILSVAVDNYRAAASRIGDVDVAAESAGLVRNQILQQASASVLSHANLQPEIVLRLL